ncbi:MAG: dTDP-4-dehydrorhamnose 3,5-epimerase [Chloroflexota bacterium]|nr:dTDP-4-dehydrorhamnose 3,5-epimerase [Chloroflexota bacterium]
MLRSQETRLAGLALVQPETFADERGFFLESYSRRDLERLGITSDFLQDNHSRSVRDTVRGLHFQIGRGQAKLVRAARGRIWDVVVDIRADSPTFGEWEAFELDDVEQWQLYVPVGFAHGFCAISEIADVCYKVSAYYDPATERGIAWDDQTIGIPWPTAEPMLSDRDRRNPTLAEAIL